MSEWQEKLVTELDDVREILRTHRRVVVLGIKPDDRPEQPAHYVPKYLQEHGFSIVPAPTYYPDVTEILGEPVQRDLRAIDGAVDVVDVFRRPQDIDGHVEELIALGPKVVWFQRGIRNDDAAARLAQAGIRVVQDRCMLADHRELL